MTPVTALTLPCIVAACTNPVDVDHRIRICGPDWQHAAMNGPWELTCAVRDAPTVPKRRQAEEALATWLADNMVLVWWRLDAASDCPHHAPVTDATPAGHSDGRQ